MATRWRYAATQTDTRNVARVASISFRLISPAVVIEYEIGDDTGGQFVVKERKHIEMEAPLPAAIETLMENMNTRALAYLQSKGILPAGAEEAEAPTAEPTR